MATIYKLHRQTIDNVLNEFLLDQSKRLSQQTYSKYDLTIIWFRSSMNNYAYQPLSVQERLCFEREYEQSGKQFCEFFGPEKISENMAYFLNHFMVRKVWAGKATKHQARVVIKKLQKWLVKNEFVRNA